MEHRPGAEEQQALEEGMVEHVEQRAGKAEDREAGLSKGQSQEADAETQGDDPDVLDAVVGQQPFEVVLRQGEEHAEAPKPARWR